MSPELLAALSGVFGLYCIGREVRAIVRAKQIRISNLFLIMYGLTYGVILSLILILYDANIYKIRGYFLRFDYTDNGISYAAWWFFAAVIGYFAYRFASVLRFGGKTHSKSPLRQTVDNALLLERLQYTSIICLLIGVVCFWLWVNGWGGYTNLFLNAAEIRNGTYEFRNPVAFFAKPAQIVATVSMTSLYLIKQKKHVGLNAVLFLISFVISLMYYMAKDGRMVMAMYLLIVLFMWDGTFEKQEKMGKKFARLMLAFVLFVLIVLNMDQLTFFLRNDTALKTDDVPMWQSVLDELGYIYVAGQTSVEHCMTQGSPLLIGHEIGLSLFAWLPSSFTPDGLIDVWNYNTYLIGGRDATAQFPSDLISTSLYDLGLLGPALLPGFWGALLNKFDRIKNSSDSPLMVVLYYSMSMALIRVVNYSMFSATIASAFHIFVAAVVFWLISRIRFHR